jgi:type IV pilus assembly protein PilV
MRTTSKLDSAGFSLLELMVSMVIILVALLGLLEAVGIATANNMKNQLRDEAVLIGEERMADLLRRPFALISTPQFPTRLVTSRVRGTGKNYVVTRTATRQALTNSYEFVVNVGWSYKNMSSHHEVRALRTYVDGK